MLLILMPRVLDVCLSRNAFMKAPVNCSSVLNMKYKQTSDLQCIIFASSPTSFPIGLCYKGALKPLC